jgi:hypothetical protein
MSGRGRRGSQGTQEAEEEEEEEEEEIEIPEEKLKQVTHKKCLSDSVYYLGSANKPQTMKRLQ